MSSSLHQGVTHVVLRHKQQPAYQQAVSMPGISIMGPEWVMYCATEDKLLPILEVGSTRAAEKA